MSNEAKSEGAGQYEIRLEGHLHARWTRWFDGLQLSDQPDGTTVLSGSVADQSALHGLLQKIRDTGLPLVSVTRVSDPVADHSAPAHHESERN